MKPVAKFIKSWFEFLIVISIGKKRAKHWLFDELDKKYFSLLEYGYLNETGWTKSIILSKSIDKNNQAIPWLTYPFISLMEERINNGFVVLEIGSGASTDYFSQKTKRVISFEDNIQWFEELKIKSAANVELYFYKSLSEIDIMLQKLNSKFDIVLIDNFEVALRPEATLICLDYLNEGGVLILDDFETNIYDSILKILEGKGFKKISFCGMAPCISYLKSTALFYRDKNCFGI